MIKNVKWLGHSTIKFLEEKVIYIDPYNLDEEYHDADIIFITHNHYDHFSGEDIKKCMNSTTKIVVTKDLYDATIELGFKETDITCVLPNKDYEIDGISFSTVPSYNIKREYHPKENEWVGYVISINDIKYYVAGDTDLLNENKSIKCDVAFLPVGGTFTMTAEEAAELANVISPKVVVPIHYGSLVGTKDDAINFKNKVNKNIICEVLEK